VSAEPGRVRFLDLPLDPLDMDDTIRAIEQRVEAGTPGVHVGLNAANLVAAHDDPAYRADLVAADLCSADGQSVVWGARQFGIPVPERVTGIDLMERLLDAARDHGWGVYLLGAKSETVVRLAVSLRDAGVRVDGYRDGYFDPEESRAVAGEVRRSGAALLFVALPSPEKERFMIGFARPAGVPFSIGVGGAFDVLAGDLHRAPRIMQRTGMEWLYRLVQEPKRLFGRYASTNTRYLLLLAQAASRRRLKVGR
jgi:N-acetylglucosaminyldiphosphoundecaprenol N-acetyl-beta-D-mannosaminyltransferase